MKKKWLLMILPVAVIVLECLPYGAVLNFAGPEGETFRETYSYFSLVPFGYANFGPLLTALLTCAAAVLLGVCLLRKKAGMAPTVLTLFLLAAACSLGPLILGLRNYSWVGGLISGALAAESFLIFRSFRK